jgi:uncharacterized membrane protein YbaN (DUF454 family)
MPQQIFRLILIAVGSLSVALGVIGIFVPLMPTTVFLLLAAACYARSSERFYRKLVESRWLGSYIRSSREGRGMSRGHKIWTLTLLWVGIGASAIFSVEAWWIRGILLAIAVAVTVHVARIKVAVPEPVPSPDVPR